MIEDLNKKILSATKWSAVAEILSKLITPIVSIVLARLLTPEAFGIVTTLTMIISFAEIFTDAGFQKYIIQHNFNDKEDLEQSVNVAFWSNLVLSLFLWGIISLFADALSSIVGNPGLGYVLIIACISIPIEAFSSIQFAIYKRNLDFKTLLKVRIIGICVPLFITIPLAFYMRNFWALVIGTIAQNVVNALCLTIFSSWKPKCYYSFLKLKEMLSFSIWSMIESVSIWATNYIDIFLVGTALNQYYLGLYKTSSTTVGQITSIVTSITTPILFSALSRLQNDKKEFENLFFTFQKCVGLLIIPLGVGIFCFSDFITLVLLGNQWMETSGFIGLWGLTSALTIVLSHYSSEVYRAKGRPKLSVLAQFLHIIVLGPAVYIAVQYDYHTLYVTRSLVRLELILVNLIIMYHVVKISPLKMLINIAPACLASVVMACVAFALLHFHNEISYQILFIVVCIIVYAGVIYLFPKERAILQKYIIPQKLRNHTK